MRFAKLTLAFVAMALVLTGLSTALSRTLIPASLDGSVTTRRPTGEWPNSSTDTWYVTVGGQTYVASPEAADGLAPGTYVNKPPWSRDLDGPGSSRLGAGGDLARLGGAYAVVIAVLFLLLWHRPRSAETKEAV